MFGHQKPFPSFICVPREDWWGAGCVRVSTAPRKRMSSIIEGPLGLNIDQLETIHALVGLRDCKRKRSDNLSDRCTSFLRLRQPTGAQSHRAASVQFHEDNIDLNGEFDSVLNKHRNGTTVDYPTGEPTTSKDFCFIFPDDIEYLSEYLFLLFTQVKKGIMDDSDRAKRFASSQLNFGFRCKHCGGAERVNDVCFFSHYIGLTSNHFVLHLMLYYK